MRVEAPIHDENGAAVAARADQTAEALPETQHGIRQNELPERIVAVRAQALAARFDERLVGDRKR